MNQWFCVEELIPHRQKGMEWWREVTRFPNQELALKRKQRLENYYPGGAYRIVKCQVVTG